MIEAWVAILLELPLIAMGGLLMWLWLRFRNPPPPVPSPIEEPPPPANVPTSAHWTGPTCRCCGGERLEAYELRTGSSGPICPACAAEGLSG